MGGWRKKGPGRGPKMGAALGLSYHSWPGSVKKEKAEGKGKLKKGKRKEGKQKQKPRIKVQTPYTTKYPKPEQML